MTSTAVIAPTGALSDNPVSDWLAQLAQRRGQPKRMARVIKVSPRTIYGRVQKERAWTADDVARLCAAYPEFKRQFDLLVEQIAACT